MFLWINMLDIQKYQICGSQKPVKMGHDRLGARVKGDAGGVQAGVDTAFFCLLKELCHKTYLHQRFAAADRDAAFFVKRAGLLILVQYFLRCHGRTALGIPCIRIMAIETSHGTSA